jgi:hypothetical protein
MAEEHRKEKQEDKVRRSKTKKKKKKRKSKGPQTTKREYKKGVLRSGRPRWRGPNGWNGRNNRE